MSLGFDDLRQLSGALILTGIALMLGVHFISAFYLLARFNATQVELKGLVHDLFGLSRKIEGLSAGRRALIVYHFDMLLERLAKQLPSRISAEAGEVIFRTESSMLKALADLEPNLKQLPGMKERVESLVSSMEMLESTVVSLTGDAVRQAISDTKRSILEADRQDS